MPAFTLPQAFALALQHHQAGRLAEAEDLYLQILRQQPHHVETLQSLGVLAAQRGRPDRAVELIGHAIALAPKVAAFHCNLGEAYRQLGRLDEAIAAYRQALELQPDLAAAHTNLGLACRQQGRLPEAIAAYRQALKFQPDSADAFNNMGVALSGLGRLEEGIAAYQRALQIDPQCAKTLNNLAGAFCLQGRLDDAIVTYRRALQLQPEYATAQNNLAGALLDARRLDEAIAACRAALRIRPDYAEAHNHLGSALRDQGLLEEAVESYERAVALNPASAATHSNLLYALLFDPRHDRRALRENAAHWEQRHGAPHRAAVPRHGNDPDPARRLRVGYVSPDFRDHVIGRNLIPLFAAHDRAAFEITCYSAGTKSDALTARFRALSDHWRGTLGLTDDALAAQIRADHIDILVDLTQHMAGNRLPVFARQPAPVQVSFAGYPESTGLTAIGHRISDPYLEADLSIGESGGERVSTIDSFWCYDPCGAALEVNSLPAGEDGPLTFGCLNNFCKINEPVLALWARVLRGVPASRLLVLSNAGSHRERVLDILGQRGVAPERVEFVTSRPRAEYLALYHRLDVALDTFPYNGHTTSLDALWMGVPVISLAGETPVSRAGLSVLSNLGLPELVARTADEYVRKATELASDRARLRALRAGLRRRMEKSVLMDIPHFARQIEQAYRQMWRGWCGDRRTPRAS